MADKEKDQEKRDTGHGVHMLDGKYFCSDCAQEMKMEDICPQCRKEVDWEKVRVSVWAI